MGVHGLWKTVLRDYSQSLYNFVEVIDFGATLLVDASSFLFHLLNQQIPTIYKRYSFPRECGGCYRLIDEVIRLEIKRLRQKLGFGRVIFYFDGPVSYYKKDTKEKRRKQIQQQWEVIYELSVGLARSSDVSPSQLPLPPLAFRVLNTVLKDLNMSIVSCPAEADQQMAIDCQRLNQSQLDGKTIAYCYSSDSDYLIMKDIPLIALGSLDDEDALSLHLKQQRSSSQLSIAVVVWRRSNIAKLYSCSEDMLVKWAILIGNDYTRGFEKSKFHPSLSDDKFLAYNDLLDWLKDHDDDNAGGEDEAEMPFRISKIADYRLRRTCEYSYLFYELEDVSPLCTEDSKTASDMLEGSEFDDGILLLPSHRESIETWLLQKQASNKLREETLASLTVTFLQDYVVRNRNQKQAPAGSSSVEDLNKDLGSIFSVDHIDVIVEMIDQLIQNALNPLKFSLSLLPTARTLLIQWEDVLAGNFFQLVAKEIDRAYYQLTAKTQSLPFQPSFLYDGLLFHHLLQKKRMTQDQTETGASNASVTENVPVDKEKKDVLPIDEYREEILARIDRSRVVVLSGETGCGKSTRVPIFIYEQAKEQKKKCRIIICQPRRIACVNLKNRLQEKFGDKVGLRMGHGVREESAKTQIFFVTSGYLVRLLAHHPHSLDSITHLIIDEVHERSVDNDLLCYLIKRNISHYKKLHLILMSATVQTTLYQDYFNDTPNIEDDLIVEDAISVGVRRFPVETVYVEGVMKAIGAKDQRLAKNCEVIVENCQRALDLTNQGNPQGSMVPLNLAKAQYDVCVALIHKVGKGGSGILIFVSGMSDILELQSRFEVPGGGSGIYKVIGIHSEIPFEDQLEALQPPQSGEIKIIIATNAAESSVTLPNVDVVICLGTHKAVSLQASNTASNKKKDIERSVLTNVWISKSSAIQRAGRTGRIRPGKVYRLYSEELYEKAFIAHESAEIHRKPLYEVIITLKCIFEDDPSTTSSSASLKQNGKGKGGKTALLPPITTMRDILENLIESVSPDLIDAALSFLYYQQILTSPSDTADSKLTSLGLFTAQSSTDLTLSKLMIYGITLGVGIESIIIAAALSQPKTVFRIAHPSIHKDPDEFNSIIAQTFLASVILDDGSYSDALMMVRLFVVWHYLTVEEAKAVMNKYGIVNARIRHFISSVKHLVRRCSESNGALRECLDVDAFLQNSYSTSSLKENYDVGEQVDDGGEPELTGRFVPKGTESSKRRKHLNWRNFKEKDIDVKLEEYVKRVVLSEETVMKIRLILLWTFNHNLLTSVPNGSELGEDNTEQHRCLEIKKDNALPIQDVLKYFPSTAFSLPPLKEFSGKDSANTTKVILTGKYHYSFELKTSFQTITSSEHTRRSLHELLVAKMISLWRQSQIDAAQPVVLVDSPSDKAGTKFDIPEENNESAKSDNKKNKDAKKKKKGDQKESSSSDDLKAEEKISSKGNKSKMGEKQNKSQIKTTEDPNPSQLFDTVDFLQHVTQITMQEVVEETKPKEKNKKGKKSSTSASSCVYSLSIAVFLNYRDTHQLELSRPLIQSLILLLQRYEPEVRTEPIFFSKQSDDSEDGTICYFNIKKFTISTAEMNQLYQYLLGFSGIIQVLSQGKVNETSSNSKGSSMNESLFPTSSKISVVNWKPSRTFLINYLTQLDSRTLWSEDQNFHHTYKRVKEEDVKYKIFFPQHVAPPSDSFVDEKFCDYSDYLRLFNAYALGNKERKMKVTIASTDETTDIKGGEGNKKAVLIVPGSVAWKQQKESEKKAQVEEETFPKVSAFNKEIREIPIKAKTSSWKIIGQLHQGDDEVVLSDLEGNIVDLTKVPWHQANISGRGPISTSWLHVEREIFDSHNGEVVKKVKETVYGVCYSATVSVSTVTGKERIMCEGVTLFPSRDWTRWALLCSGYMIGLKSFESEDDEATILRKIIICREVFELLQSLKNYRVEKKETIITLLDELFH